MNTSNTGFSVVHCMLNIHSSKLIDEISKKIYITFQKVGREINI